MLAPSMKMATRSGRSPTMMSLTFSLIAGAVPSPSFCLESMPVGHSIPIQCERLDVPCPGSCRQSIRFAGRVGDAGIVRRMALAYHLPMTTLWRRLPRKVFAAALMLLALPAGCAGPPMSLKGPNRIQDARQVILRRVRSFHSEAFTASVQVLGRGLDRACTATVKASGPVDVREVIDTGQSTLVAVDNGTTAWTYTEGGAHYGIASALSPSGFDLRWAAGDLAPLLSAVHFTRVRPGPGRTWTISFSGRVSGLGSVRGSLAYLPAPGVPASLTLHHQGTTVNMAFSRYRANPSFGPAAFHFTPPPGTT